MTLWNAFFMILAVIPTSQMLAKIFMTLIMRLGTVNQERWASRGAMAIGRLGGMLALGRMAGGAIAPRWAGKIPGVSQQNSMSRKIPPGSGFSLSDDVPEVPGSVGSGTTELPPDLFGSGFEFEVVGPAPAGGFGGISGGVGPASGSIGSGVGSFEGSPGKGKGGGVSGSAPVDSFGGVSGGAGPVSGVTGSGLGEKGGFSGDLPMLNSVHESIGGHRGGGIGRTAGALSAIGAPEMIFPMSMAGEVAGKTLGNTAQAVYTAGRGLWQHFRQYSSGGHGGLVQSARNLFSENGIRNLPGALQDFGKETVRSLGRLGSDASKALTNYTGKENVIGAGLSLAGTVLGAPFGAGVSKMLSDKMGNMWGYVNNYINKQSSYDSTFAEFINKKALSDYHLSQKIAMDARINWD